VNLIVAGTQPTVVFAEKSASGGVTKPHDPKQPLEAICELMAAIEGPDHVY
jgi:hypothetical protein